MKTAFLHIPKTAGASITKFCELYNIQCFSHNKNAKEIKKDNGLIESSDLENYCFLFTVVRNPYRRIVSFYEYDNEGFEDFESWLKSKYQRKEKKPHYYGMQVSWKLLPQWNYISDKNKCLVDYIIRYENIREDFNNLCSKLKIDFDYSKLPIINSRNYEYKFEKYFKTHKVLKDFREIFEEDFKYLGYDIRDDR